MAKQYSVTLTGVTPLLMHNDNLDWADLLTKWGKDPNNKKNGVAGDDRSPAWRWIGNLYVDGGVVCVPADNVMTLLREGGAKCPTGKKGETYKRHTQSGMVVDQAAWPLETPSGIVRYADQIKPLIDESEFSAHVEAVAGMGFMLFAKRAKIGTNKHVRVRPRFDVWSISGTITVLEDSITRDTLQLILETAGKYCGLCDWRPSSPKSPGAFGKFTAKVK